MMEKLQVLTLLQLHRVGRKTAKSFLDACGGRTYAEISDLWYDFETFKGTKKSLLNITKNSFIEAYQKAELIQEKCMKKDINIVGWYDSEYPNQYRNIPDPPLILFTKGNIAYVNNSLCVAVIGTRQPSQYGLKMSYKIGMMLAKRGAVVVSGLAIGCDSAAHIGCIQGGGQTIAILANGLDTVYPKSNEKLSQNILDSNGCLLSEYPPETQIINKYFVERDRLQSGLSAGVVVIETNITGGTMHTVAFAQKQGREIACLDHSSQGQNDKSRGNTQLILQGAFPIGSQDQLDAFIMRIRSSQQNPEFETNRSNIEEFKQSEQIELDLFLNNEH